MIALPATSQVAYSRNDTTYTCYNKEENRVIGIMLLEGERDAKLLDVANNQIGNLEKKIVVMDTKQLVTGVQMKLTVAQNEQLIKLNNGLQSKADRRKTFGIVMTGIAVILGVIVAIK